MTIRFKCPCGKALKADDGKAGRRAKCPKCGAAVVIEPSADTLPRAVEQPARPEAEPPRNEAPQRVAKLGISCFRAVVGMDVQSGLYTTTTVTTERRERRVVTVPVPDHGTTDTPVRCPVCGETVVVKVRSIEDRVSDVNIGAGVMVAAILVTPLAGAAVGLFLLTDWFLRILAWLVGVILPVALGIAGYKDIRRHASHPSGWRVGMAETFYPVLFPELKEGSPALLLQPRRIGRIITTRRPVNADLYQVNNLRAHHKRPPVATLP